MNTETIKTAMKGARSVVKEKSPVIFVGTGIALLVSAGVTAVVSTPKAIDLLDKKADEKYSQYREIAKKNNVEPMGFNEVIGSECGLLEPSVYLRYLGPKDSLIAIGKAYWPAAVMAGLGIGCIIFGTRELGARNIALAGAASLAEKTLSEYKDEVKQLLGEEKEREVASEVVKKSVQKKIDANEITIVPSTNVGHDLVIDTMTGRAFYADLEEVRSHLNDFNHELIGCTWCDLNEWYYHLGIPGVALGDHLGWPSDVLLDIRFDSVLTYLGKPAIVLDYVTLPKSRMAWGM